MRGDAVNAFEAMGEWGYCRWCRRLELLTDEGKLPDHASSVLTTSSTCPGAGYEPTEPPPERYDDDA